MSKNKTLKFELYAIAVKNHRDGLIRISSDKLMTSYSDANMELCEYNHGLPNTSYVIVHSVNGSDWEEL